MAEEREAPTSLGATHAQGGVRSLSHSLRHTLSHTRTPLPPLAMFSRNTQKQSRHILRPQLAQLAARARTGPVSGDATNCIAAGMAVFVAGHTAQELLLAKARTGKEAPTIQGRDAIEALRMDDIQPSVETLLLVAGTKDRKRFNRARYEEKKAERAAAEGKPAKKSGKKEKKEEAAAAAAASPSKKRARRTAAEE